MRRYSELILLPTFEERFEYLKLNGDVGKSTFGFERYLNQNFYRSKEWSDIRHKIIVRDMGCDLAINDREILWKVYVHHMNPLRISDFEEHSKFLLNPEYLISVSFETHNAIHYGDESLLVPSAIIERQPNDTCPWRK